MLGVMVLERGAALNETPPQRPIQNIAPIQISCGSAVQEERNVNRCHACINDAAPSTNRESYVCTLMIKKEIKTWLGGLQRAPCSTMELCTHLRRIFLSISRAHLQEASGQAIA